MLSRCYVPSEKGYKYYGAVGVSVDPSWFNFNTFFNDVQLLPNYDKKVQFPDKFQLDKDYMQQNIPKEKINGEKTQNQLHEITLHSFNTINAIVSKPQKPEPLVTTVLLFFFIFFVSFLYLGTLFPFCDYILPNNPSKIKRNFQMV